MNRIRILCVREAGGLGDVLCTLVAVRGLREKFPRAEIDYACAAAFKPLLDSVGDLDNVFPLTGRNRRRMCRPVNPADWGLDGCDMVCDFWCPANRAEQEWIASDKSSGAPSRIESFCNEAGVAVREVPRLTGGDPFRGWARKQFAALCPGEGPRVLVQQHSAKVAKDWPIGHRAEFAALAAAAGLRLLSTRLTLRHTPAIPSLMGCSHLQLAALCAEADAVLAPDSGLFHVAAAVGAPCVALFGPTDPEQYARVYPRARFLWARDEARAIAGCDCPCLFSESRGFRPRVCLEEGACMAAIAPRAALDAVLAAVDSRGGGSHV